jgi:Holliday junction DNA helicase RuvB
VETHAAAFKKTEVLFSALIDHSKAAQRLNQPLLFFIDEIHRLNLALQEGLYQALKEWWIPTPEGKKQLPPFTLIGATTRFDMLDSNSFVTRFENVWEIQRYPPDEIAIIVADELSRHNMRFSADVARNIAGRCLGIPRTAINLANKIRRAAQSQGCTRITLQHCCTTFELEQIDDLGLQHVHHRYLEILHATRVDGHFSPLGVGSIAAKMRQPEDVIKGSVEPILLELDFVAPTPRGRMMTLRGSEYFSGLGLDISNGCGILRA